MAVAGERTRLITLASPGAPIGANGFNEAVHGAGVTIERLARRMDMSDGERFASGQVGSYIVSRFVVLSDPETRQVTPVWTLTHEGADWNIHGVKETQDGRHRFIEITAAKDAD